MYLVKSAVKTVKFRLRGKKTFSLCLFTFHIFAVFTFYLWKILEVGEMLVLVSREGEAVYFL